MGHPMFVAMPTFEGAKFRVPLSLELIVLPSVEIACKRSR